MNTSSPVYHPCSCTHLTARVEYLDDLVAHLTARVEDLVAGIDTVQTAAMLIWVGYQLGTRLYAWCQQKGLFLHTFLLAPKGWVGGMIGIIFQGENSNSDVINFVTS